jgi:hypothetical protein
MKRSALTLLLLSTFLFGLVAGPHPCHEAASAGKRMSGHSSCHKTAVAKGTPSAKAQDCCGIACQHACHLVAVLSVEPVISTIAPVSQRPVEKAGCAIPPVAFGIDHIPLA